MGEGAVNTSTIKVTPAEWNRPVADKTTVIGNTVSQVQNPDVTVSVSTNPITPPNMIVAKATQETNKVDKAEAVKAVKSELVMDISKYLKTTFLDLEEDYIVLQNQRAQLLPGYSREDAHALPSLRFLQGKPKNFDSYSKAGHELTAMIKDKMEESFKYKDKYGAFPEGQPVPEWIKQNAATLAKKLVYYYSSHRNMEDFGMDIDYLTMPIIEHNVVTDKFLWKIGYTEYSITTCLAKYDDLLKEYTGVGTVGKLGRELKLDGVELYNLWKKLDKAGIVADYNWELKDDYGKVVTDKTSNKWLEIANSINVKDLVASLNVSPSYSDKLVNYFISLQNGKKRDDSFIKKYEELKVKYRDEVIVGNYYVSGFRAMGFSMPNSQESFINNYGPMASKWIKEYRNFEKEVLANTVHLFFDDEESVSISKKEFFETLEKQKKLLDSESLPLGQEFLFQILEKIR